MINYIQNPYRIRVDTSIKVIEKDGSEYSVPVVVIIKMEKLQDKQQVVGLHNIVHSIFNKRFIVDKTTKPVSKSWWKLW